MTVNLSPLIRFVEHLPTNGDLELSLLKCHLLIEEVLTKLILRSAKHPSYVEKARLSFAQKAFLARSLSDLDNQAWLWGALKKLNDARNELAHGLSIEDIRSKLNGFVAFVEAEQGAPETDQLTARFGAFHWAAFKVFTVLAAHAHFDPTALKIGQASAVLLGDAEPVDAPDRQQPASPPAARR